jgi:hypothetical protein
MKILCLEQGDWADHRKYSANYADWESRTEFGGNPNLRKGQADYPVNCDDSELTA